MIGTADELASILPALEAQRRIAIDTEADSLHSYFEKLCLIQISIPGQDFLVDPLAGYSLTPLFTAWEGKQLILHGADYDLRLLRRCGYDRPSTLFDTMIAARLCGVMEFSLAAPLLRYFSLQAAPRRGPLHPRAAGGGSMCSTRPGPAQERAQGGRQELRAASYPRNRGARLPLLARSVGQ